MSTMLLLLATTRLCVPAPRSALRCGWRKRIPATTFKEGIAARKLSAAITMTGKLRPVMDRVARSNLIDCTPDARRERLLLRARRACEKSAA